MDLSTIRLKIDRKKYKTWLDSNKDIKLMINNCLTFNEEASEVVKVRKNRSVMFVNEPLQKTCHGRRLSFWS
jgi:hypothetical protein